MTKSVENPLCLCEYYNKNNERTHILFCCCNCEALDQTCTHILCQRKSTNKQNLPKLFNETLDDILDRIRIPSPKGAIKINTDLLISLITIIFYISIGTINILFSIITLVLIPCLLYIRFFQQRFNNKSTDRNQIAYYMSLVSLVTIYLLYNFYLKYELSEQYFFHNCLFTVIILLHVYLHYSNPGYLVNKNSNSEHSSSTNYCAKCQIDKKDNSKISHCPICSSCIYSRDHHCFWLDNCIGYLNHKIFFIYLILIFTFFLYSQYIIITFFSTLNQNGTIFECLFSIYYQNFNRSLMFLLMLQLISLTIYSFLILLQQFLLISINYTQYEMYKYSKIKKNFSLFLFLIENFKLKFFFKNFFKFFFKFRNKKNLVKLYYLNEKLRNDLNFFV
jgi:palmitoyltransferase